MVRSDVGSARGPSQTLGAALALEGLTFGGGLRDVEPRGGAGVGMGGVLLDEFAALGAAVEEAGLTLHGRVLRSG